MMQFPAPFHGFQKFMSAFQGRCFQDGLHEGNGNTRVRSPSTLTRRFAPPSPSGRGIVLKPFPLPLGEGGAKRRVRVEGLPACAVLLTSKNTFEYSQQNEMRRHA